MEITKIIEFSPLRIDFRDKCGTYKAYLAERSNVI